MDYTLRLFLIISDKQCRYCKLSYASFENCLGMNFCTFVSKFVSTEEESAVKYDASFGVYVSDSFWMSFAIILEIEEIFYVDIMDEAWDEMTIEQLLERIIGLR